MFNIITEQCYYSGDKSSFVVKIKKSIDGYFAVFSWMSQGLKEEIKMLCGNMLESYENAEYRDRNDEIMNHVKKYLV